MAPIRGIRKTAPYFHDGSAKRLDDAVRAMARYNLGRKISDDQVDKMVEFLGTLTGEYEGESLDVP